MDLVNLAHGSLYMIGAYFAATFVAWTGSFVAGAVLALGATLLVGMVLEVVAIRPLYGRDHLDHVLGTFGLVLFFNELVRIVWGPAGLRVPLPDWLNTSVPIFRACNIRPTASPSSSRRLRSRCFSTCW